MKYLLYLFLLLISFQTFPQGTQCDAADPFCSSEAFTFPNNYSGASAESGPNYDCLETVPNPAWYYLYIDNSGSLTFTISQVDLNGQGIDVDFICYGPFADPIAACQAQLTAANIVACSYSPSTTESFTIPNAQAGEYYIVLITNYSGEQGNITFQQTNAGQAGSGTTDCSIVCTVSLPEDTTVCIGSTYTITSTLGNDNMTDTAVYTWYQDGVQLPDTTANLEVVENTVTTYTYRVEVDADNCDAIATDEIQISFVDPFIGFNLNNLPTLYSCDDPDTNTAIFDLTENNTVIVGSNDVNDFTFKYFKDVNLTEAIPNPSAYETVSNTETIYVQIFSNAFSSCYEVASFEIQKNRSPRFEIDEPVQYVCENIIGETKTFTVINPEAAYTYVWKDESDAILSTTDSLVVSTPGIYTVEATTTDGFNCQTIKSVELIGVGPAQITETRVKEYYIHDNFSLEVFIEGNGFYEYALNDINGPYQDEPLFKNLKPGIYTIYVREKNGCGISSKEVAVFGFPKFFTPNDDNINDVWMVPDLYFINEAKITIFDRYGRVLHRFYPSANQGWNGLYNGKQMPPTDYWFTAEVMDRFDKKIIRRGHFSLIR